MPALGGTRIPVSLTGGPALSSGLHFGSAMLATIFLPLGGDRVNVRDMPALFAEAIHPELSDDTPRVLYQLQKEAIDPVLAAAWCGNGNNFPVSLSDEDLELLNKGVWRDLKSIEMTSKGDGPRTLKVRLLEPEWEAYRAAFEAVPPSDWQLSVVWHNPVVEQWLMHHEASKQWKHLIATQALAGAVKPRQAATLIPTAGLVGNQLEDSFLTIQEFTDFAGRFDVQVVLDGTQPQRQPQQPAAQVQRESPEQRQNRRLDRFQALGGAMKRVTGAWHVDTAGDRRGKLAELVKEEKAARRPRSDRKDVSDDLGAAAERQRATSKA